MESKKAKVGTSVKVIDFTKDMSRQEKKKVRAWQAGAGYGYICML